MVIRSDQNPKLIPDEVVGTPCTKTLQCFDIDWINVQNTTVAIGLDISNENGRI
jgi:hypothetical protein